MVILVKITEMSSIDQVTKKTRRRNGRKKSSKTLGTGIQKLATSRKNRTDRIDNYFSSQCEDHSSVKQEAIDLTLEVAFDVSNEVIGPSKKDYVAPSSSTVGFLKMSPYRQKENAVSSSDIHSDNFTLNDKSSLYDVSNAVNDNSWDCSLPMEDMKGPKE